MARGVRDSMGEAKNSIDNPGNVADNDDDKTRVKTHKKKDVQNQIQESNTQMSFKVNFCVGIFPLGFFYVLHILR